MYIVHCLNCILTVLLVLYIVSVAGMTATVIYSYDAEQNDELSLSVGDIIYVLTQVILLTYLAFLTSIQLNVYIHTVL